MNVGTQVSVNGQLAVGRGVVEAVINTPSIEGMLALPRKLQSKVRNQQFPQCWVRLTDGRLMHYNGDDIRQGVVTEYVAPASAPAPATQVPDNLTLIGTYDGVVIYVGSV